MTRATYNAWVKDTWVIEIQEGVWQVGVKNSYAKEWLESRLYATIKRTVSHILGLPIEIEFIVPPAVPAQEQQDKPAANPQTKQPNLENNGDLWQAILARLKEDVPTAAFHIWLSDTYLISHNGHKLVVGTRKSDGGLVTIQEWREWMEHGAHAVISRVAAEILGQAVEIEYVSGGEKVGSPFTPHLKQLNAKTGYAPLPHYYLNYWENYLTRRWKTAGRRAFLLQQKLVSLDKRKVTSPEFTNWSPSIEMTYEELGELLSVHYQVITGRKGHCQKYEEDRKFGQDRGENCCKRHEKAGCQIEKSTKTGQQHCYFWRPGVLEVLDTEKWIVVDAAGKNRHHKVRLQVWHSPAVLTPFQVSWLPKRLQDKHLSWLMENAIKFGWEVTEWLNTPNKVETFMNKASDYEIGRIYFGHHQPNPYKPTEQFPI